MLAHLRCRATILALLLTAIVGADEPPKAPELHTVSRGPIKVEVELEAILESQQMWPVEVRLEAWQTQMLEIVEPITHGTRVRKGDTLVAFDTQDIDRAIRDAELAAEVSRTALENAEHDLQFTERSVAMDMAAAERSLARAETDLEYFMTSTRPITEQSSLDRFRQAEHNFEYTQEELRQLEKMYKEDDLTEETEEIILTRQKRAVEFAENFLLQAEDQHRQMITIALPRREEDQQLAAEKAKLELDRARETLPLKLESARQALSKARFAHEDATRKLTELRQDREAMTLRAPADGVVYLGRCERGRWVDGGNVANAMRPGGGLRPGAVFMTIVATEPLFVRADVPEVHRLKVRPGMEGWLTLTAGPDAPIPSKVESLNPHPGAPNQFDLAATLAGSIQDPALTPGMTGKLKLIPYEAEDVVKVPLSAVKSDTPGEHHVFVKAEDGSLQRRAVKLGQRTASEAEVLEGLAEGEQIHPKGEPDK